MAKAKTTKSTSKKATKKPTSTRKPTAKKPESKKPTTKKPTTAKSKSRTTKSTNPKSTSKANVSPVKKKTVRNIRRLKAKVDPKQHPVVEVKQVGTNSIVIKITHDKNKSNRSKITKLNSNPNPKDRTTAYVYKTPNVTETKNLGNRLPWKITSKEDKETIKVIIEKNKNNPLKRI